MSVITSAKERKLHVNNCILHVANSMLQIVSLELQVKNCCKLHFTNFMLQITYCKVYVANYILQISCCKLHAKKKLADKHSEKLTNWHSLFWRCLSQLKSSLNLFVLRRVGVEIGLKLNIWTSLLDQIYKTAIWTTRQIS